MADQQFQVESFFQEETAEALVEQAHWLSSELGFGGDFLSNLVHVDPLAFAKWLEGDGELPERAKRQLLSFWRAVRHVLSVFGFDLGRVRIFLSHPAPPPEPGDVRAPAWAGTTLRSYLEQEGAVAIEELNWWITASRFGDQSGARDTAWRSTLTSRPRSRREGRTSASRPRRSIRAPKRSAGQS